MTERPRQLALAVFTPIDSAGAGLGLHQKDPHDPLFDGDKIQETGMSSTEPRVNRVRRKNN